MNWTEIELLADAISAGKAITLEKVLEAMEEALGRAAYQEYKGPVKVTLDQKKKTVSFQRIWEVVEAFPLGEHRDKFLLLDEARKKKKTVKVGDILTEDVPPIKMTRVGAQLAKQVLFAKVRQAEQESQYQEFSARAGTLINGVVRNVDYAGVEVDVGGNAEIFLPRKEMIPQEMFRQGDHICAYLTEVESENKEKDNKIILSRTHPQFLVHLFAQQVPEIYENIIEIKAVARDPGSKSKVAVLSNDAKLDPIGACVGMRGSRVRWITSELQGERIDIVPYSDSIVTFVVNALGLSEVTKVIFPEEEGRVEVVVPENQLSLAIGRRGQNVRLAHQLTGFYIDIRTEEQEAKRKDEETTKYGALFAAALDVDEIMAQFFVTQGFRSVEDIVAVGEKDLIAMDALDEEVAKELYQRASTYLAQREAKDRQWVKEQGMEESLFELPHLSAAMLRCLAEAGILTLQDVAALAGYELSSKQGGILKDFDLLEEKANEIVMEARKPWFTNSPPSK